MVVGFQYISISKCGVRLIISRSRKLTLSFCSGVGQSSRLLCMLMALYVIFSIYYV